MTNNQAAHLQLKWKLRSPPLSCPHLNKELGYSENGNVMGTSHCVICGAEFSSAKP